MLGGEVPLDGDRASVAGISDSIAFVLQSTLRISTT